MYSGIAAAAEDQCERASERASLGVSKKSSLVQVKHLFTRRDGKVQTIAQPVFDMCPVTVLARTINRLCGDLIKA